MSAFIAGSGSPQDTVPSFSYIKELSYSKYPIYLAANPDTNQQFVIKSFPFHDSRYKKEKEIFMALRHPHIIQLQETIDSTLDRMNKKCSFLKLDYAQYGDLLEIISKYGKLPETLVRTLFHQMLDAISYMHEQTIAHLDLKVDNLLIDENFDLKVTDFDLSQKLSSTSLESRGTPGCRAPEIKQGLCKDLKAADVYSAAIVLFVLLSGNPPYGEVNRGYQLEFDGFYKAFRQQNNRFWETHAKHRGDPRFYSEDFKELFTRMVEEDPATRMTIKEIKETKWYQGPVWDKERCRIEMRKYMNMCTEMCEESKM